MRWGAAFTSAVFVCLSGCTALPSLPEDYQFPIDEILRYTTCQLRSGYRELATIKHPRYSAADYTVAVALQPKVDGEITAKAGFTGKNGATGNYISSWGLGAAIAGGAPGAGVDARSHQDGKVSYNLRSEDLINQKLPVDCEHWSSASHTLVTNLQVRKWLVASTTAALNGHNNLAVVDNQGYTAEIYIKYDIGGAFTYTFPLGTDFASASGQYWTDQFLTITITHNAARAEVIYTNTLPSDDFEKKGVWKPTKSAVAREVPGGISPETKTRLDLLQLQQSIQNLPTANPR
ncbi:hypothetical protein [Bradyrhizobium sp. USDA 3650]